LPLISQKNKINIEMKLYFLIALDSVSSLEPLKCFKCFGKNLDDCLSMGRTTFCNPKNQQSCMLTERRQNGEVISVSNQSIKPFNPWKHRKKGPRKHQSTSEEKSRFLRKNL
jgi:hypothetical protein